MVHDEDGPIDQLQPSDVLDAFVSEFPSLIAPLVDQLRRAEREAVDEANEYYRLPNHRGTRAMQQSLSYLGQLLIPEGFSDEPVDGQLRFHHRQSGWRLCVARGSYSEQKGAFRLSSEKGQVSRDLIDGNGLGLGYELQPRLMRVEDIPPESTAIRNLWLMVETHEQDGITVYLAYPKALSPDGQVMYCEDCGEIGRVDLSPDDPTGTEVERTEPPVEIGAFQVDLKERSG